MIKETKQNKTKQNKNKNKNKNKTKQNKNKIKTKQRAEQHFMRKSGAKQKQKGGDNNLKNNIIKIFNKINISNDEPRDYISIYNMFDYKKLEGGSNITYYIENNDFTSDNLKTLKFNQNDETIDINNPNIIIIGGGPVGLYMSIILKLLYNEKTNIYILEKRCKSK